MVIYLADSAIQRLNNWCIGVEVEQETSAPPPKKILDPPLVVNMFIKERQVSWNSREGHKI